MSENMTSCDIPKKRDWRMSQAELDRYVRLIAMEGEALLLKFEVKENREKLNDLRSVIRQREDESAGVKILKKPKTRPAVPIEAGRIDKFMRTLRRGDRITYRTGRPWGKPLRGVVKKTFPHIVLIEGGVKSRTVMPFDILKCELGLIDDGWSYQ